MIPKTIYRMGLHRDIFSHSRFSKITRLFVRGKVRTLEIGTGGGPFSIELLERENILTIVEINENTAQKTRDKIKSYFPDASVEIIVGHANKVQIRGPYHQVILLEVLEHVKEDRLLLKRLSDVLEQGGRLLISTPTATAGLLRNDAVTDVEDGGHVRVGYSGPELDEYLREAGFITISRDNYGYMYARIIQYVQRLCNKMPTHVLRLLGNMCCVLFYRLTSFMDKAYKKYPAGQITLAVKK